MASISRTPSIYQIRHIESGRVYVGSTNDPSKRWKAHRRELDRGTHHSEYLQRAWNKYGTDAFVFEIIEPVLFIEDLISREQYWIDALHACDEDHGFNCAPTAGSTLGVQPSEATRKERSERLKALWSDPEYRAKMTAQSRAIYADPEARKRQSARIKAAQTPELKARIAERARPQLMDPVLRKKRGESLRARLADPAMREKMSERAKAQWADPAYRAKRKKNAL